MKQVCVPSHVRGLKDSDKVAIRKARFGALTGMFFRLVCLLTSLRYSGTYIIVTKGVRCRDRIRGKAPNRRSGKQDLVAPYCIEL
jgi:hypothetical protein